MLYLILIIIIIPVILHYFCKFLDWFVKYYRNVSKKNSIIKTCKYALKDRISTTLYKGRGFVGFVEPQEFKKLKANIQKVILYRRDKKMDIWFTSCSKRT